MPDKPFNILLFGIDSLSASHMSCYGYRHLTTPYMDQVAAEGVLFTDNFCPHVPTTSGYGTMLTGLDTFSNTLVALRHEGTMPDDVKSLAEILRGHGYESTCVGFQGNPAARGFDNYLNFAGWGAWAERPSRKAENLNAVAIPELDRLAAGDKPFFLFLRHMDPHSPYLPPAPYDRMFYHGNECDPDNHSLDSMKEFKPFRDYLLSWMPPGITDKEYVVAQYDGEVAYMDACIQVLLNQLDTLGLRDNTLVIINADHGETLDEHDCWFDHHGMYECTLHVPLILRLPGVLPEDEVVEGITLHQDLAPTIMDLLELDPGVVFDGKSQLPMLYGEVPANYEGFYITEATWMRKHGWRTAEWKLMKALEPDFHWKPETELYNLKTDPGETNNLAESEPLLVQALEAKLNAHIAKREAETGREAPIKSNVNWHGNSGGVVGPFTSSQQAYDSLYIGGPQQAAQLQDKEAADAEEEAKGEGA
jgi:arylsulfatase A-like enzyme